MSSKKLETPCWACTCAREVPSGTDLADAIVYGAVMGQQHGTPPTLCAGHTTIWTMGVAAYRAVAQEQGATS